MNIHFTDKLLFNKLKDATLVRATVGSHLYGSNTSESDIDYLYIYATSENELNSMVQSHHQLQYNEDGIDHVFVSLHSFIKNCLSGDSTINFEVIQSDILQDTCLEFIHEYKELFKTQTIIKSYLGLAKRDIKYFHKADTEYLKRKRLGHIVRGYLYANSIMYHRFDFNSLNKEYIQILNTLDITTNHDLRKYDQLISICRDELNRRVENKTINLSWRINVEDGIEFNESFLEFVNSELFKHCQKYLEDFNMSEYINTYENWVNY